MIDLFLASLMASFAVYYLTDVFLVVPSEDDSGPFESHTEKVVWAKVLKDGSIERDVRNVHFWDRVRRVFGLYEIMANIQYEDDTGVSQVNQAERVWYIRPERVLLWGCPHCLGFWMSILPGIFVAGVATGSYPVAVIIWMPIVLTISGLHSVMVSVVDALYTKNESQAILSLFDEDDYDSDSTR